MQQEIILIARVIYHTKDLLVVFRLKLFKSPKKFHFVEKIRCECFGFQSNFDRIKRTSKRAYKRAIRFNLGWQDLILPE